MTSGAPADPSQLHPDVAAVGREFDGVVEQIRQRLSQQLPVALNLRPGCHGTLQRDAALFADRRVQLDHARDQFRQVDRFARHGAGLGQRNAQQRIQGAAHVIHLGGHPLEHAPLRPSPASSRVMAPSAVACRRLSGVRKSCAALSSTVRMPERELLDLVEHAVDLARQGVDLIVGIANRQPLRQVARA